MGMGDGGRAARRQNGCILQQTGMRVGGGGFAAFPFTFRHLIALLAAGTLAAYKESLCPKRAA
jgi:hypothetical protein